MRKHAHTVIITVLEGSDVGVVFDVEHDGTDPDGVRLVRQEVSQWLSTEAGQEAWEESGRDFNWGDLALYCRVMPWSQHLQVKEVRSGNFVVVDHDERLHDAHSRQKENRS